MPRTGRPPKTLSERKAGPKDTTNIKLRNELLALIDDACVEVPKHLGLTATKLDRQQVIEYLVRQMLDILRANDRHQDAALERIEAAANRIETASGDMMRVLTAARRD